MKINCQRINKRRGFTLVETLTSLLIFSLIILMIGMVIGNVRQSNYQSFTTQFYSYLDLIERQKYKMVKCQNHQLSLAKDNKLYFIRLIGDKLVISTNHGGYEPLMNHVKNIKWNQNGEMISQHIIMTNGQHFNGKSRFNES